MNSRLALYAMLALVLVASAYTWWSDKEQAGAAVAPAVRHTSRHKLANNSTLAAVKPASAAMPSELNLSPQDLFSDAASTEAVAPPAPPSAPELPFVYAGKLLQDAQYAVFLSLGERNLVVRQGDIIDQQWRVDSISPPTMQLSYLPMRIKRVMNIGAAN